MQIPPFSLKTNSPEEGLALALKLARLAVKATQPSDDVRHRLRLAYEQDTQQLIAASHVAAVHFQTIAQANGFWLTPASS